MKLICLVFYFTFCVSYGYKKFTTRKEYDISVGDFVQSVFRHKESPNLVQLAQQQGLQLLLQAIQKSGLHNVLDHEGPFTWFGPTDQAFQQVPKFCYNNPLRDVMQYHIAKGSYSIKSLKNEQLLPALLTGRSIRINIYHNGTVITGNGRVLTKTDLVASNGQLDILNEVMCALYIGSAVVEITRCPPLDLFAQAVNVTNLYQTLNGTEPLTVFVPTDDAVNKLPKDIRAKLESNLTALTEVVKYHVVRSTWYSVGLTDGQVLTTLQGSPITITLSPGKQWVNKASLILPDATVSNGVVHAIDAVLLPPGIAN